MLYRNHEAVGRAIQAALHDPALSLSRADLCIITKVADRVQERGHDAVLLALEASLRELRLTYVDYVLLHNALQPTRLSHAAWGALVTFQQRGGCRHLGVSNFSLDELQSLHSLSSSSVRPRLLQTELSPWSYTAAARDLVSWCQSNAVVVQSHSPLVKGRFLDHPLLQRICTSTTTTHPAAVLCAWQRSHALWCVVRSSRVDHIDQLFSPQPRPTLSSSDLADLDRLGQQCDAAAVTHPKVFRCF